MILPKGGKLSCRDPVYESKGDLSGRYYEIR